MAPPAEAIDPTDRATAYALDVTAGRTIAGPHVRNACRRHLQDLVQGAGRELTWDLDAAKRAWSFFETYLVLSEGQFENVLLTLAPSQAFIVGSLFGWKRAGGARRFRRAYIEQGKGNGKSPLAGGIGLYGLMADGEAGAQVYAAGAKKEQAGILFADAVKMVRKSPKLMSRLAFSGGVGREYNIAHHRSGSFFRPVSKDTGKAGSGPRPHFVLADELHEHPDATTLETLERGFKFRRQPLLVMITNSGSDPNTVCGHEHKHACKVAAGTNTPDERKWTYVGEAIDDTTFSYVCAVDEGDDPLRDPRCWIKANPLLGVILEESYLAGVVAQAKAIPSKANGILRLHFCVWTDAANGWVTRDTLDKCLADFDPAIHAGKSIACGIDLSGTQDLSAVGHVVETGVVTREREDGSLVELPTYDAWIEAWIPGDKVQDKTLADSAPYDVWVREGWLRAPPGPRIRFDFLAAHFAGLVDEFEISALGYDRYAYSKFADELDALGLTIKQVEHPQGGKRRARPDPEDIEEAKRQGDEPPLGLWMPGSLNFIEELIIDGRIRIKRNPVFVSAAMSAATEEDPFGNRWFSKRKATQRIDPLVALTMAAGVAQQGHRGPRLTGSDALMVI